MNKYVEVNQNNEQTFQSSIKNLITGGTLKPEMYHVDNGIDILQSEVVLMIQSQYTIWYVMEGVIERTGTYMYGYVYNVFEKEFSEFGNFSLKSIMDTRMQQCDVVITYQIFKTTDRKILKYLIDNSESLSKKDNSVTTVTENRVMNTKSSESTQKTLPFISPFGGKYPVCISVERYQNNGNLALQLYSFDEENGVWEPAGTMTINQGSKLAKNQAVVKNYSENEGMLIFILRNELGKVLVESNHTPIIEFNMDMVNKYKKL